MSFQPGASDVYYNAFLTNLSIGYKNAEYIADQVFPPLFVDQQTGIVPKYTKSAWFRDEMRLRAPGDEAQETGWGTDNTATYAIANYALKKPIPDEVRASQMLPYDMDRDTVEFLTDKAYLKREVNFTTSYFATSKWTTDWTGVAGAPSASQFTQFSDYGLSSPIQVIRSARRTVRQLIQRRPNVAVFGDAVWDTIVDHPDLVERIKGGATSGQPAVVTRQYVAQVLELDNIYVGSSMYTASAEGTAEASVTYSDIWGKAMLLMYVPPRAGLMVPAAGYTFIWRSTQNPNALQYIRRWRDDRGMKDVFEVQSYFQQYQTSADAGLFMTTAIA